MAADIGRIKGNIDKMIAMGAPETDIDAYVTGEGVSLDQLQAPATPPPLSVARDPVGATVDAAKSLGVGVGRGVIGLAGLPGDIAEMGARGLDRATQYVGGKLGVDVAPRADQAPTYGSADIQKAVEDRTGEFYKPQTVLGEYAQTGGEFATSALGPGGVMARGLRVAVPAGMSETAGQMTKGTTAEPWARIGAALAGGAGTARIGRAPSTVPTKEKLFEAADKGYTDARALGVEYKPQAVNSMADQLRLRLDAIGIDDTVAPTTFKIIDRATTATPPGSVATYSNVENLRKKFGNAAGSIDPTERKAGVLAKKAVDDFLENPQFNDVIRGDALKAGQVAKEARQNSAAAHRAKELDKKEVRAELRASAANSGQNVGNTMRQRVADMLIKEKEMPSGASKAELDQMTKVVEGTKAGNTARYIGNLAGGGGGLGQAIVGGGAAGASYVSGDPRYMAIPAIGVAGRAMSNASTMRQVEKLNELIRSRSPLAEALKASAKQPNNRELAAMVKALMGAEAEPGKGPLRVTVHPRQELFQ